MIREVLAAVVLGTSAMAQAARPAPCDRACLEGFINQYLDALVSHKPFGLPLAPKIQFTENEQLLEMGDGTWNVVTGVGPYKLYVSDPQSGQAGFFGTIRENGTPAAFSLRLKIENRRISEIEVLVARDPGAGAAVEARGHPNAMLLEAAPAAERVPRAAMTAAIDKYMDGIEAGSGDNVPFDPECTRIQNGIQTTNNPALVLDPKLSFNPIALGCKDQLNSKFFSFLTAFYPRRYPLIDDERQLVWAAAMGQIAGNVTSINSPGHGQIEVSASNRSPSFLTAVAVFKMRRGRIRWEETVQTRLPYGTPVPFFGGSWRRPKK
jgi:hypothetical protein